MKTKFILSAMCLPLAFAACTNEEVFVENNQSVLEDQPVVDFKVSATYGSDGAESRMVNNNGTFLWEGTDELGAVWNKNQGASPAVDYNIYSNNKFINSLTTASASADFTTDATTVVGDYVFYYPYNTAITKNLDDGITYSVPEPQYYDPNGDLMMDNNFMISPNVKLDGNEPGELTLPLTLRSIYGFGKLNIAFPESGMIAAPTVGNVSSVKIQKIIITYTSNVYAKGSVNLENVPTVDLSATNLKGLREGNNEAYKGKTDAELTEILFTEADRKLVAKHATKEDYAEGTILSLTSNNESAVTEQVSISCITDEYPMGVEVNKNQPFSTRVLLPTATNQNITVSVYTDRGMITYNNLSNSALAGANIKPNHTVNLANPNRKANVDDSFVLSVLSPIQNSITVIGVQDFIASMAALAGETAIEVTLSGDFELTPEAINAIPSNLKVTFANAVKLNGNMTLKNIKFNDNVTIKGGNVNISDKVEFTASKTITIEAGSLNVSQGEEATEVGANSLNTIVKSGAVLNLADGVSYNSYVQVAGGTVNAGPAVESRAATTPKGVTIHFSAVANANKAGILNVNVPVKLIQAANLGTASTSNGTVTINVNANITGANYITLATTATLNNYATVASIASNAGTIYNYATLGVTTNSGTINNEADAIAGEGTLTVGTNSGKIYTVADSQTDVTTNDGTIYYAEGAFINGAGTGAHAENGNVLFTMDTDMTGKQLANKFYNTPCTSILIKNATLTVEEDTDLSKLAAAQAITLDAANLVANDTVTFHNCPVYVYNNVKVTGEAVIAFAELSNDKLNVKDKAIFETEVVVAGLSGITIGTGTASDGVTPTTGKVVARTNIYGNFDAAGQFTTTNWVGTAYQQKTIAELTN